MITKSPSAKHPLVADRRLQRAAIFLDPALEIESSEGSIPCVLPALFAYVTRSKPLGCAPDRRSVIHEHSRPRTYERAAGAGPGQRRLQPPAQHWPWHRKPPPPPPQVHELLITTPDGRDAAFPQYWKGNTLVVDLQPGGSSGSVAMRPREHTLWPVRIAFRVMPGQFGVLEVRAHQRLLLPITPSGARPSISSSIRAYSS